MARPETKALDEELPCEWFAKCDRTTTVAVWHPILHWVPCCQRCAEQVGMNPGAWNARMRPAPK